MLQPILSFTLYNCLLFFSPYFIGLYQERSPGSPNPIQVNDVFFCLHAVFIQVIISEPPARSPLDTHDTKWRLSARYNYYSELLTHATYSLSLLSLRFFKQEIGSNMLHDDYDNHCFSEVPLKRCFEIFGINIEILSAAWEVLY